MAKRQDELKQKVHDTLVQWILEGSLKPGDKIPELRIANNFGISRTPVREAMRQLYNSGILEYKPNCNPTVADWTDEKIEQLEVVRTDLENLAARLAIENGSNREFEKMRQYSEACYQAGLKKDIVGQLMGDADFHTELGRISKNDLLTKFLDEIHMQNRFVLCWRKDFLVPAEQQYRQHEEIVDALLQRDEQLVIRLLSAHNRHFASSGKVREP